MFFFVSGRHLGYKLQHYVVRETTHIYKTMISLDSYISFASTNIREAIQNIRDMFLSGIVSYV